MAVLRDRFHPVAVRWVVVRLAPPTLRAPAVSMHKHFMSGVVCWGFVLRHPQVRQCKLQFLEFLPLQLPLAADVPGGGARGGGNSSQQATSADDVDEFEAEEDEEQDAFDAAEAAGF